MRDIATNAQCDRCDQWAPVDIMYVGQTEDLCPDCAAAAARNGEPLTGPDRL